VKSRCRGWAAAPLVVVALAAVEQPRGQTPETGTEAPAVPGEERSQLEAIRGGLVELRFEEALAAAESLLGRDDLSEPGRVEALVLRSQAHVALGDFGAAEEDYREILRASPGFTPDPPSTPSKAQQRFDKVRAATVGELRLAIDPSDAKVRVDGREAAPRPDGVLPLVAGAHDVEVARDGFDPRTERVEVAPGETRELALQLVPNARSVVVVTEPDGVAVRVDGAPAGHTRRPAGSEPSAPAELRIESLPLGEHAFELSLPCFRTEERRELVAVDLLDRSPLVLPLTRMVAVQSAIVLRGGPEGAEVRVDGAVAGRLPLEPVEVCPGTHDLDVRFGGRVLWAAAVDLRDSEERLVEVLPRPNLTILGAVTLPERLAAFATSFNETFDAALPGPAEPSTAEGWSRIRLPEGTDLVLAPSRERRRGSSADGWFLYSPILGTVAPLDEPPARPERPAWTAPHWGFSTVDSAIGGPALVAELTAGGTASAAGIAPGDRVLTLGGVRIESTAALRATLALASPAAPLAVTWTRPGAGEQEGRLHGKLSPHLVVRARGAVEDAVAAAWATVDAVADPALADAALANLALLLSRAGLHDRAVETWRRVAFPDRPGIGPGTVQYYVGCAQELAGRDAEAARAYRAAAGGAATTLDDGGPPVAPAARDRLTELEAGNQPAATAR
jgi:hypothetical protein